MILSLQLGPTASSLKALLLYVVLSLGADYLSFKLKFSNFSLSLSTIFSIIQFRKISYNPIFRIS